VSVSLGSRDPRLSAELAGLRTRRIPAFPERQAYADLARSYDQVSDALNRVLNLDSQTWERARPSGVVPSEQMITNALADVLRADLGEGMPNLMQRALLSGCSDADREFYRDRPLKVVCIPRGCLGPDLVLDGSSYHPDPPVSHMFVIELKYLAHWQVPYARRLYGMPTRDRYNLAALWGFGHDDQHGVRVPHIYGTRTDCHEFWHHPVGGGLYVASAVQLDIYVAYAKQVLGDLGLGDEHGGAPLRVRGVLVDAWAREVKADLAVTWPRWTTVSFADLLAEAYGVLSAVDPGSAVADRLKVLLARLLWL
jgi:hypothetical protein